jgi:hypothetical protein
MLTATFVTTAEEIEQMAGLSAANLVTNLTAEEKAKEGFVTWSYPTDTLRILHSIIPSIIVKDGDLVVGYAIVLTRECATVYEPMRDAIRHFAAIPYKGKSLMDHRVYLMGQICVHPDYRGKGVFGLLYGFHRQQFFPQYEILVTEISTSNPRSMRAHAKTGFVVVDTRLDETGEWNVVVWDWMAEGT